MWRNKTIRNLKYWKLYTHLWKETERQTEKDRDT